ncbi:MAG: RING-HC finger protein [Candidatus Endonucleobacter bathymodioli]|uniref:RING-HC finger protein n=1 Tax=Candidatus Endonucleibacter bathymodioli TaxID=539814 RepID=A0AA90P097_9GAMM|nr:RING-HC finger protein [Candidatus Endonucleobacter bathymodioli]
MKRALSKMMFYAFIIFFIPQRGMAMLDSIDKNMPDHWVPINKNIKIIVPITLPESEIGTMVDLKVENSVTDGLTELHRFVYGDSENQEEIQKTELSKKIDTINKDNKYPVIVNSIDNEKYCHLVIKQPDQECLELYTINTKLMKSFACAQNTLSSKEILPPITLKKNIIAEDRADDLFDIKHCSKELLEKYHTPLIENNKDTCFILYISCHMKETGANDDSCPLYAAFLFIKKNSDSLESFCRLNIQDESDDIDEDGGPEEGEPEEVDTLYSQQVSKTTIDIFQNGTIRLNCGGSCNIECKQSPSIQAAWWDYTMNHIKTYEYKSCFIDHNSNKPYAFAVYMSMNHMITVQNCKQILERPPNTAVLSEITGEKISDIAQATQAILDIATKEAPKRVANTEAEAQRLANAEAEAQRLANAKAEAQRLANAKAEAQRLANAEAEEAQKLANAKAEAQRLANEQASIQTEQMQNTANSAERVTAENRAPARYPEYATYQNRLNSYDNWPRQQTQNREGLAKAGYFYTGNTDVVRCFCCDLGLAEWDSADCPWREHARHATKCWFLQQEKGSRYISEIKNKWKEVYSPKSENFEHLQSRLDTFNGVWRADITQTPQMLADAGFYYTGEEDTVRCHYCDGGLRYWEPNDIPWEQHAEFFGYCKFLIKMQGRDYIESIKNAARQRQLAEHEGNQQEQQITGGSRANSSETASSSAKIWRVQTEPVEAQAEAQAPNKQQLLQENKKLKEAMKCIECKDKTAVMLFKECGHRVLCEPCSNNVKNCPVPKCNKKIKKQPVKTYLS